TDEKPRLFFERALRPWIHLENLVDLFVCLRSSTVVKSDGGQSQLRSAKGRRIVAERFEDRDGLLRPSCRQVEIGPRAFWIYVRRTGRERLQVRLGTGGRPADAVKRSHRTIRVW